MAERSITKRIDDMFVKDKSKGYEMVCKECYRRIEGLRSRFKPSFRGYVSATVLYDPESKIFTIRAFNEYGDSAYLREGMRETRSLVRSIWTCKTAILKVGRVVGVV